MENRNSHLTVKERTKESFPTRILFERNCLKGKILDFGCGLGTDVTFLKQNGFEVIGYDKYYFPEFPQEKFDTIICNYVLNVLLPEEQTDVLMEVSHLLKPTGKAYFTVRRDVKKNGFVYNPKRQATVYQCNVKLPFASIFQNEYCEIYEYQHYKINFETQKDSLYSLKNINELVCENVNCYAIYEHFSNQHNSILIIPKRIVANYFDLDLKEQMSIWLMTSFLKSFLEKKSNPTGFKISIEIGESAGQISSQAYVRLTAFY